MYALAGLPFLIPGIGIEWLRLWDEALLVLAPLGLSVALFSSDPLRRHPISRWVLTAWGFLFLMQAGVYAPLALTAAAVWLVDARLADRRLAVVLFLGTFYLGISRWFWMAAPPVWVITLLALEESDSHTPDSPGRKLSKALPMLVACGLGAVAAAIWTAVVEHRSLFLYLTSTRQPMLWYRWLPNATSPYGVLPWVAVVVAPLCAILLWLGCRALGSGKLRRIGTIVFFGAGFLAMGLTASVKIGGGDNLHNLDLFFVYLLILTGLLAQRSFVHSIVWPPAIRLLVAAALLLPMLHVLKGAAARQIPDREAAEAALQLIAAEVREAATRGPVLFIDQRQLLTFGYVSGVPLVMGNELVDLMDKAMANDLPGLQPFYEEIAGRRYSLIVSDPLPIVWRGSSYKFGEENDAWVERVTIPILESYQPVAELDDFGIWLLGPRPAGDAGGAP